MVTRAQVPMGNIILSKAFLQIDLAEEGRLDLTLAGPLTELIMSFLSQWPALSLH